MANKICRICQKDFEIISKFGGARQFCYDCVPEGLDRIERTTVKRQSAKKQALKLLGGKCLKCGETKAFLIDFHHVVSEEKEHSFASLLGDSKFEEYFKELEKAVPLCGNCHREFHYLQREENISIQDFVHGEKLNFHQEIESRERTYIIKEEVKLTETPKQIIERPKQQMVEIEDYEKLIQEIKETSYTAVAAKYGISANAIKKRLKARGYPYLINDIKEKPIKEEKPINWRDLPLSLTKNMNTLHFDSGRDAIQKIAEIENSTTERVSEGLNRVINGKRLSYLGYTL